MLIPEDGGLVGGSSQLCGSLWGCRGSYCGSGGREEGMEGEQPWTRVLS